ncbi:MAG TPA: CBS and ACT domain-containing protein [Candidatus Mailhella merdigallinarum]|uniref:CBS and ACT domain-containing protein n=1 Tax=Candidatus Mailhella merdigallinarum TaxID=2838658 RepID=A0A9D2HEI7_9BACT|nr:CBS domain-containing protein [Desulfovibrionaceae bacterium]PWM65843.1 MAG: hypothetical protein DBX67_09635 [Desulfovibrionaceae bacterium]HJA08330.1 CBS and ACT domain-containing protein [Candidatus Mailhella merdigallinarum]
MLIRDWMTTDVITATPETSMLKVSKMMKEYDIRRVPVVDAQNKVVGIVSDRDVKDASPSKATTLDMHELYYLLSEIKVRDIMTPDPVTVEVRDTVERVALLMEERAIGGLPVVDDEGSLVGIITDHDIFKVLVQITGVRHGGVQVALAVEDLPGVMRPIFDLLREYDASLISMLSSDSKRGGNWREVFLRIRPMERAEENRLVEALRERFDLLYWVREKVHEA